MQENRREKSLIKRNILQYLECKGVTEYKFYKDSGVSRGVLSQNNGMSEDNIAKFLAYAQDVNTTWLLTGIGPMLHDQSAPAPAAAPAPAPVSEAEPTAENQVETISALINKVAELARENGRLRERVDMLERERERMFVHSGGGKLPSPTPPAAPSAAVRPEASSQPTSSPQSGSPRPITRCDASKRARK